MLLVDDVAVHHVRKHGTSIGVRLEARGVDACVLQLDSTGGNPFRSQVWVSGPAVIRWRWQVPSLARRARWQGSVDCGSGAVSTPFAVRVLGDKRGVRRIVGLAGVSVAVSGRAEHPRAEPKWTERGQFWVGLATLVVTAVGLYFVYRQLRATREQGMADRSAQLVERYQTHTFLDVWSRVGPGYLFASDPGECFQRVQAWQQAPHAASRLVVHPHSPRPAPTLTPKVDRDQLIKHFGTALVAAFHRTWWWVHWRRSNRLAAAKEGKPEDNEIERYAEWQRMANTIVAAQPNILRDLLREPRTEVWVACVPDDGATAPTWQRHKRVSVALSRSVEQLEDLLSIDPKEDIARESWETEKVVCVPPSWHDPAQHKRIQVIALTLSKRLEEPDGLTNLEALASA